MEAFPEIFNFNFPSMLDFEETLELVRELWNNFPRREFGGRPPRHFEPGPMEKTLYHTLLSEAQANIDPDDYPSPEAAQKAVDEFCRKWLRTPQEELAGKTPEEVILEEREARGDQRKSIDIRITVSPIPDFDANKAERLYREGLEAFKRGDWIKAVECFDEVTEMYPEQYKAWGNLGSSLANLGLKEAAIMCLERALEIKPDYQVAKENLAHVKEMSEEKCEALRALAVVERLTRTLKGRKTKDENR
jgi:tetratricopeptide (TPR) repeat protein